MNPGDLPALTIAELRPLLEKREVSPREVVEALHGRIEEIDPQIGAYLSFDIEDALRQADAANVGLPLGGVPIAIKDIISVAGQPCTCASKILSNYRAPYDATVVRHLKAAGAIVFGKTNMDEFAMGSSTENSSVKPTRNPWDQNRVPGGSSGGSAAAVAGDEAFAALGTDTGGSIRQPAAFSGVVGFKPSYGRVSRFGLVAFASSLDQAGTLTKTVEDAALLLGVIAGPDPQDATCASEPVPDYSAALGRDIRGVRLGLPKEYFGDGIDPKVRAAVKEAAAHLESLGAEIVEVSLPHTEYAVATYYMIASAEASANLARFDGVRYGHRADNPANLLDLYGRTRAGGFGPEVKRRIILGTYVLSAGYYDEYYNRAQNVRRLIRQDFTRAFAEVDALVSPTTPEAAFRFGERSSDPLRMYLADIFTIAASLAGICGISLPCGFTTSEEGTQLPLGLQLLGKPFEEARILGIAHAYEQSTEWHRKRPPLKAGAEP
ncbi:MAG TPA: Asp-tRNA(Asn)/Glu-tRNA(Gln) amidotransferase subunit GatA [Chthoniobacterales bacterium]|jgi:aspartyl-tRNA(Asn)/glutamyl-tRNA(Gln) amidotransferase subunit A|nr:Asp-tRNA(Asn)/Glu-tRNA(Gln) amidotransferase subunit GatA [Chthoniobacterales bacterium]